jgi:hypothetical protein
MEWLKSIFGDAFLLSSLTKEMIPHAASRMGIESNQLKKRYKGISTISDPRVNAHVFIKADKKFKIYVNSGYNRYVFLMLYLFCSRIRVEGGEEINPVPPRDLSLLVESLMHAYWDKDGQIMHVGGDIKSIRLNKFQRKFLTEMILNVQRFTISHELGHVIISDFSPQQSVPKHKSCVRMVNEAFSNIVDFDAIKDDPAGNTVNNSIQQAKRNWVNELEADLVGLQLLLDFEGMESLRRGFPCIAALIYFILGYTADRYYEIVCKSGTPLFPTHPPCALRLSSLYSEVIQRQDLPGHDLQFYEQFKVWTDFVLKTKERCSE